MFLSSEAITTVPHPAGGDGVGERCAVVGEDEEGGRRGAEGDMERRRERTAGIEGEEEPRCFPE